MGLPKRRWTRGKLLSIAAFIIVALVLSIQFLDITDWLLPNDPITLNVSIDGAGYRGGTIYLRNLETKEIREVGYRFGEWKVRGIQPGLYLAGIVTENNIPHHEFIEIRSGEDTSLDITLEVFRDRAYIYFDPGSTVVNSFFHPTLDFVAEQIQDRLSEGNLEVVSIESHIDERIATGAAHDISIKRATAVQEYLLRRGIGREVNVKSMSYGDERPLVLGHEPLAWLQNNVVEIILQPVREELTQP
jgi:outer membrane protein OmpA-like peptidoglycan-associated protein